MDDNLIVELFWNEFATLPRQGPGSSEATGRAFYSIAHLPDQAAILDIGCGSGAQTLDLAKLSNATIHAVDTHHLFLEKLQHEVGLRDLNQRVIVLEGDMNDLTFPEKHFDVIWSEGAIYIMGLKNGLTKWRKHLKDTGHIAFTEVCWIAPDRPVDLQQFWDSEYPDIRSAEENIKIIEECDYQVVDHFVLPAACWWDDYYTPLEQHLAQIQAEHRNNKEFIDLIEATQHEIDIFRTYSDYYSYVFFTIRPV